MIKYKLFCKECNLKFDSWFASSKEYDKLKKGYWLLLDKNEEYFYDTRFQYLLWVKVPRPTKKRTRSKN